MDPSVPLPTSAAYAMRPVTKPTLADSGYTEPTHFSWTRQHGAYDALVDYFHPRDRPDPLHVPAEACFQAWLDIQETAAGQRTDIQKKVLAAIQERVTARYKQAGVPLLAALGPFCSYCETYIPGLLEVEHVANRDNFPFDSCAWANFLLSCGPCNTQKGAQPTRAAVRAWSGAPVTESEMRALVLDSHAWPHVFNDTFQRFPVRLFYRARNGAYQPLALADSVHPRTRMVSSDVSAREVTASIVRDGMEYDGISVRASFDPRELAGRSRALHDLCGLGVPGSPDSTYDRRMFNRTLAWFRVLDVTRMLAGVSDPHAFDALFRTVVLGMAPVVGFWSVWVTILSQFRDPGDGENLAMRFCAESGTADRFPGTDASNILLPRP